MISINKQYPGPKIDHKNIRDFFKVKQILNDSTLVLQNGERIGFAGCDDCGAEFTKYLQITFSDEESHVYFIPTGFSESDVSYAYIWEVDFSTDDNDEADREMFGPMFSQLNEASMINKWCKPVKQPGHKYFERYVALSKIN